MNPELVATNEKLKQLREQNLTYCQMLAENMAKYKAGLTKLERDIQKAKSTYKLITEPRPVMLLIYPRLKVA